MPAHTVHTMICASIISLTPVLYQAIDDCSRALKSPMGLGVAFPWIHMYIHTVRSDVPSCSLCPPLRPLAVMRVAIATFANPS